MSGFHIYETVTRKDGVIVSWEQHTLCSDCGADLLTSEDWSEHRRMHTVVPELYREMWADLSQPKDKR